MSSYDETNSYVQGGGHNYYLSYSLPQNMGSYSEYDFPYGTEENPMVIYIDSTGEEVTKVFVNPRERYLYENVSPDNYERYSGDELVGPELYYEETVMYCEMEGAGEKKEENYDPKKLEEALPNQGPQVYYEYKRKERF
jgi:hypothetical protein